jgi:hypothetical protein
VPYYYYLYLYRCNNVTKGTRPAGAQSIPVLRRA